MKRGLVVKDAVTLGLARFSGERQELQELANDGWVRLENSGRLGLVKVTTSGRWLIRTIAAVFDPQQQQRASGSRLV